MSRTIAALVLALAAAPVASQAPAPAPEIASAPGVSAPAASAAAVPAPVPVGAKVWLGRYSEYEEYLRTAPIERVTDVPVGVTRPKRAFFTPGGLVPSVVVKHLPMGQRSGFWESYKSEVAAYELDRIMGLDMVPPTLERRVEGNLASIQLWVEGTKWVKDVDQSTCPRPMEWAKQVCRQRVFDNLIANIDRNAGNLLVDGEWNLILIDHSRAFASDKMPFEKEMTRVDREMLARLEALDEAGLMTRIRPWVLSDGQVRAILKRRDRIVAHFERLARERGEAAVFPF
jgi:hypothetical protein